MAEFSHLQEWVTLQTLSSQHLFHLCASGSFLSGRSNNGLILSFSGMGNIVCRLSSQNVSHLCSSGSFLSRGIVASIMGNIVCQAVFSISVSSFMQVGPFYVEGQIMAELSHLRELVILYARLSYQYLFHPLCKWVLSKWELKSWLNYLIFKNRQH